MAEEKQAEEGGGKSSKKLIIIIAVVVLIAIGASVGVTYFLLADSSEESPAEETAAAPVKQPAVYFAMKPPMVVTFDQQGRQRFLQVHVSLMARSQTVLDGVELHMPVIRNRLINVYGAKDFEALQTHEGRVALQQESLEIVNTVLTEEKVGGDIEAVLYTNLVMQ